MHWARELAKALARNRLARPGRPVLGAALLVVLLLAGGLVLAVGRGAARSDGMPMFQATTSDAGAGLGRLGRAPAADFDIDLKELMRRVEALDRKRAGSGQPGGLDLDEIMRRYERSEADPIAAIKLEGLASKLRSSRAGPRSDSAAVDNEAAAAIRWLAGKPRLPAPPPAGKLQPAPDEAAADRLMVVGRFREAAVAFRLMLRRMPDDAELLRKLGIAQTRLGEHAQAERSLLAAAKLSPSDPQVLSDLAAARLAAGNSRAAVNAYRMAIEADPRNPVCLNGLGLALEAAGARAEALTAFERAAHLAPDNPNSHQHIGMLAAARDPSRARKHLRKAADGFSALVEARMASGDALTNRGDLAGAVGSYEAAIRANHSLSEVYMGLARADQAGGHPRESRVALRMAVITQLSNGIAHGKMGDSFAHLGESRAAAEHWLVATRLAPFYPRPFYELGKLFKVHKKLRAARHYLQEAVLAANPGSSLAGAASRELAGL